MGEHQGDYTKLTPKLIRPGSIYGELSTLELTAATEAVVAGPL